MKMSAILLVGCTAALSTACLAFGQAVPSIPTPLGEARDSFLGTNPSAIFVDVNGHLSRVAGRAMATGTTPSRSVSAFVKEHSMMWGVPADHLVPGGPLEGNAHLQPLMPDELTGEYKFTAVYFTQQVAGVPVFRAYLTGVVANQAGFPLVHVSSTLRDLGNLPATLTARPSNPDPAVYTRQALSQFRARPRVGPAQYVIWAGIDDKPETARLAVMFEAEAGSGADPSTHRDDLFVVDAADGSILYQENQICYADITGTVQANCTQGWGADACPQSPEVPTGLPYAKVTAPNGGNTITAYADANGNFVLPYSGGGTLNVTSTISGQFFTTATQAGSNLSLTAPMASGSNGTFLHNPLNSLETDRAQVNAYLHANLARDLVVAANPAYPSISSQAGFPINVNIASTCNAFYQNSTINFYASGGSCNNTAFSTVVHHEYGHNVVDKGGSGQGAYGEGFGDTLSVLVSDTHELAIGFNNCNNGIRDAQNGCQYQSSGCSSCGSEIHACGQLLSGCVWDLRLLMEPRYPSDWSSRLSSLAINSVLLHAGQSNIAADITLDFITLNDDNADPTDGSPDYDLIAQAFGLHNLPAPALSPLKFTFPNGLPASVSPAGGQTIAVNVSALASQPVAGSGKFLYRVGNSGAFTVQAMSQGAANSYTATIPAVSCPGQLQYYFQASVQGGGTANNPTNAPATIYSAPIAASVATVFSDDFETDQGWGYGAAGDDATTGQWVRVDPVGTGAQPENDHTAAGTMCAVTGQGSSGGSLGEADIDGGTTTLVSPLINLAGADEAYFSAWIAYSNDAGSNPNTEVFPIQVSNNNGSTWVTMENVSASTSGWVFKSWRLNDFVTLTATMRVRFRGQDLAANGGSLVEAAVDDVTVTATDCTAAIVGDINGDGHVDGADLGLLIAGWGQPGASDLNGNGTTDGADLGLLIANWG